MQAIDTALNEHYDLWIDGRPTASHSGRTFQTLNPADNSVLAEIASADQQDVALAVASAQHALTSGAWPQLSAAERGRLLTQIGLRMRREVERLATIETVDNGKPLREAREDVLAAADCFEYYGGIASKVVGEVVPVPGEYLTFTRREPIGVVGQITPWNFPILMAAWKLAPALAAGNTVVLKPASYTPLSTLVLASIMDEIGIPPGVVNIVTGPGEVVGRAIVDDPRVRKVAFTGETETGRSIVRNGAGVVRLVSLELGGKSPMVVFDDADLESAIRNGLFGIYFAQGENCSATSRILVQREIYREFVDEFASRASKIRVGNGLDASTQMGPLISRTHLQRVERYVDVGREEGSTLIVGGTRPTNSDLERGNYLLPTVFADVATDATIWREEIFGPVVAIGVFEADAEGMRLANETPYGLAAAVFTRDVERAMRAAIALQAGYVWVNCNNLSPSEAPFGGYKDSGIGRELGTYAMDLYTQVKSVCVSLNSSAFNWYGEES